MNDEQGMGCVTLCHVESLTLHPFAVGAAVAHSGLKNVVILRPVTLLEERLRTKRAVPMAGDDLSYPPAGQLAQASPTNYFVGLLEHEHCSSMCRNFAQGLLT